jgi:hypothetical protein
MEPHILNNNKEAHEVGHYVRFKDSFDNEDLNESDLALRKRKPTESKVSASKRIMFKIILFYLFFDCLLNKKKTKNCLKFIHQLLNPFYFGDRLLLIYFKLTCI